MKKLVVLSIFAVMGLTSLQAADLKKETIAIEESHYHREGVEQKSLALMDKEQASERILAEEEHITIGSRAMSHAEFVEHQEKRALEQADKDDLVAKKNYYTTHEGAFHRPIAVTFLGDQVTLEDGSVWTVSSWDRWKTLDWMTTDIILITQNDWLFSSYMFKLVNQNTGDEVEVNMALGPVYAGIYTHWIIAIDAFHDELILEDGSIWKLSGLDYSVTKKWLVNDTIVIGVDGSIFSHPNILINVNMLNYASGTCLN